MPETLDQLVMTRRVLVTVGAAGHNRSEVIELVGVFDGKIVDVGSDDMTVMMAGAPAQLDDFEELMRPFGIVELQRTGRVALPKLERQAPRLRSVTGKVS